jgi:ABC-type methionine transport system ATPase subunit
MAEALRVENVKFRFPGLPLLTGVTFSVFQGGMFAITGRSGCGKTTLLELCASLRNPQSGIVFWNEQSLAGLTHGGLMLARQGIGYVFQKHALIHNFTVFDNIALPLRYHRRKTERDVRVTVQKCMEELGLFNVDKRFPNELSAAQSRCAAIARAVVMEPSLLFLDEPTAGVDPMTATGIASVLKDLNSSKGMSVVMVCNNVDVLKSLSCTVTVLDNGKLFDYRDPAASVEGVESMFTVLRKSL